MSIIRWDSSGCGFGRKTTAGSNKSTFKRTSIFSCSFTEPYYVQMALYRGLLAEAHGECMSEKISQWDTRMVIDLVFFLWERISVVV